MNRQQSGFTLIELVLVIVILGILAATALPRFSDLSSRARNASLNGMAGGIRSAAAIAKATQLVQGLGSGTSVTIEGQAISMSGGYPVASNVGITRAISDISGFTDSTTGTFSLQTNCQVAYANAGAGAYTVTITSSGC